MLIKEWRVKFLDLDGHHSTATSTINTTKFPSGFRDFRSLRRSHRCCRFTLPSMLFFSPIYFLLPDLVVFPVAVLCFEPIVGVDPGAEAITSFPICIKKTTRVRLVRVKLAAHDIFDFPLVCLAHDSFALPNAKSEEFAIRTPRDAFFDSLVTQEPGSGMRLRTIRTIVPSG